MAEVLIRDLDERVLERHRERARAKGIPLEAELARVLTEAVRPSKEELVAFSRQVRARNRPGSWPSVVEMLREDRDR